VTKQPNLSTNPVTAATVAAPSVRAEVLALVVALGERRTALLLGVSPSTLARFAAGLPCRRGTLAIIELRLPGAWSEPS